MNLLMFITYKSALLESFYRAIYHKISKFVLLNISNTNLFHMAFTTLFSYY